MSDGEGGAYAIVFFVVFFGIAIFVWWRRKRAEAQRIAARKEEEERKAEEERNKPYDVKADQNAEYMFQKGGRIKCRNPECFRMRFDYAWTCYGGEPPTHCAFCHHPFDLDKLKKELLGKDYSKKPEKVVWTMDNVTWIECPNPNCDGTFPMELSVGITKCSKCNKSVKGWNITPSLPVLVTVKNEPKKKITIKCPNPKCHMIYNERSHQAYCGLCKTPLPKPTSDV